MNDGVEVEFWFKHGVNFISEISNSDAQHVKNWFQSRCAEIIALKDSDGILVIDMTQLLALNIRTLILNPKVGY